jgi:hypothetical protein
MPSRRAVVSLPLLSVFAAGCASEPEATIALRAAGVTYTLPEGWTQEDAEDKGAVFLMSPEIDGRVAASMLIELPKVRDVRGIEDVLRTKSESLRAKHADYVEHRLVANVKVGQVTFGVLEYTATKKRVPVTEQFMLVHLGSDRTSLVFTSVARDLAKDYHPIFSKFMQSIRIAVP